MEKAARSAQKDKKKKQAKDELDRLKHAERKRRRLEKALAASAAMRSELEKKMLRKKEEQRRLDEEGAATAEAVALHVLLGDEDCDDPCQLSTRNHYEAYEAYEEGSPWFRAEEAFSSLRIGDGQRERLNSTRAWFDLVGPS